MNPQIIGEKFLYFSRIFWNDLYICICICVSHARFLHVLFCIIRSPHEPLCVLAYSASPRSPFSVLSAGLAFLLWRSRFGVPASVSAFPLRRSHSSVPASTSAFSLQRFRFGFGVPALVACSGVNGPASAFQV